MSTNVYSIRIDDRVRRMMDEMNDVNWQAEIRQSVEREAVIMIVSATG